MIIFNVTEEPIERKHISYYVNSNDPNVLHLIEIEEVFYFHPDSNKMAKVRRIEEKLVASYNIHSHKCAPLLLLKHAQDNIKLVLEKI